MKYLTKVIINKVNYETIISHGGNFLAPNNYLHEENLDYILEVVSSFLFGEPIYPSISQKAAVYMYSIIANHIYSDGNKRTGLEAAILFLRINGKNLNSNLSNDEIYNFTIDVASGNCTLEQCIAWFEANTVAEYL
jgi:death-on-curing protein